MSKCIFSEEQFRVDEIIPYSESLATREYSVSGFSSRAGETCTRAYDISNIQEIESLLRESASLNCEEARALLGRLEYQKGKFEAALCVFEGIDIVAAIPRIKSTISEGGEFSRRDSQSGAPASERWVRIPRISPRISRSFDRIPNYQKNSRSDEITPPMSMHVVSLLVEAIFLKAKSLEALGRHKEAAESCTIILDIFESALPDGLPQNLSSDDKLLETLCNAVESLPELWKHAFSPQEAISSYRRALLYDWNLDIETRTKVEKSFAMFLLYSGNETSPPNPGSQMEDSFVPQNNVEEALLLLLVILKKCILNKIKWDASVLDHLCFALSIAGEFLSLASLIEDLPPGIVERKEKYTSLALCYLAQGDDMVALNLLRNLLNDRENHTSELELLLASNICSKDARFSKEGVEFIQELLASSQKCHQRGSLAYYLLGVSLSAQSTIIRQSEAIEAFETAQRMSNGRNYDVLFALSLENAEQRKLESALCYAKQLLKMEGGCNVRTWIILARILSAQKRYVDAENILDVALDEAENWDHGELLRTKAKLQIVQGNLKGAIETYMKLLLLLQVQTKSSGVQIKLSKDKQNKVAGLEMETWHDVANLYTSLSQWRDAEICLSKSEAINPHSASRLHSAGLLYEAKRLQKEALECFKKAVDMEPDHVPSLISTAIILRHVSHQSGAIAKSYLSDALRLERSNHRAWYNLGLIHKSEGSLLEAADCFQAAALLQETDPVEPFRANLI